MLKHSMLELPTSKNEKKVFWKRIFLISARFIANLKSDIIISELDVKIMLSSRDL